MEVLILFDVGSNKLKKGPLQPGREKKRKPTEGK